MTNLDETDRLLLSHLAQNARAPMAVIAKKMGLARTTVQARLDRLERTGLIAGYTLRLSDEAASSDIRATVLVQITPSAQGAVLAALKRMTPVERAHTTAGRFDLLVQIRVPSTLTLDQVLDQLCEIDGVVTIESLIHLSTRIDRAL